MATVVSKGKGVTHDKFDAVVEGHLARARKRIRGLDAAVALFGWLALTLAFVLVMVVLDWSLHLSLLVRQVALGLYGLGSLIYFAFTLVLPMTRRLNPYYAARQIEQTLPNSKNSLVNWLDLHDEKLPGSIRGAVGHRAAKDLADADLERAISGRRAAWVGGISGGLGIGLIVALFFIGLGPFFGFLGRTFLPFNSAEIPTRTQIILEQPRGDVTVSVGQPVRFEVSIGGVVPEPGKPDALRLLYRYQQERPDDSDSQDEPNRLFQHDKDQRWFLTVPGFDVQNGFWYKVKGGDAETAWYRVTARSPSLINSFEVSYKYRPYTGWKDDTNDKPNIRQLRGTEVTLIARTNRVVLKDGKVTAFMTLDLSTGKKNVAAEPVADDPNALRFKLVLEQSGSYKIWFTSAEGERNVEPAQYDISVTPDTPPTVTINEPAREITLPANGTLKVSGKAADDLGVASAVLRLKVENGTELHPKPYREGKSFKMVDGGFPRELEYKDFVRLPDLKDKAGTPVELKPGMRLEGWVEAADGCDFPAKPGNPVPQVGESEHFFVTIGEPEDPKASMQDAQQAHQDQRNHEAQQDQALDRENQKRQEKAEGKDNQQGKPGDKGETKDPNKKPEDKNGGQGDKTQQGDKGAEGDKTQQGNKGEGTPPKSPEEQQRENDRLKEFGEKLQDAKDKQNDKPGESKAPDPNEKPKGDAKGRNSEQNQPESKPKDEGNQGEKGQCKEGGQQGEKKPDGQGKDGGQDMGEKKQGDAGDAKGGGQQPMQGQPQQQQGESKGGGDKQESTAKGGGAPQQQPGPGQPGQPQEGDEGEGKGSGQQDLNDQKFGGSKGTDGKLRREPGESKGGQNPEQQNAPTGDPKDEPKTLSRAKNKGEGQQQENKPQGGAKGEGQQQNQGGAGQGKGEAKFDKNQTQDKGTAKAEQKPGDGSGMGGEEEKATQDDVNRLKRKTKSQDAKEREDAEKQLDNIANKAQDKDVRDAAQQAKQEAQDDARRREEAKPGEGKAGGQKDPNGQEGMEEKVASGKGGGDKPEEKQAGDSKGDQPGAPGKDKGVSKGEGEKQGGNTAQKTGGNQPGDKDGKDPMNNKPGGGTGGQGDRPPDAPLGTAKPAQSFDADKDAHKQATDLQLQNIKKLIEEIKKNPQTFEKTLDELKMSPEQFRDLENLVTEKLPPAGTGVKLGQVGVERVEPGTGNGIDTQVGGQGKLPPGYEDAFKKLTQELAKPNK